ncbi:MAG: hypothetical protein CVU42_05430 [Chloroflexi bacterium HGW-Chloroflexi-4]|jgi:hypothetical protein|nr:MAG: hypothetical protein CVU42_05430 [Chloroflexi bacterium HGW-Chloroflexi-4]
MALSNFGKIIFQKKAARTVVILFMVLVLLLAGYTPGLASGTPYTTIVSVVKDVSVTISGINFPADQTFTVRMAPFGTLGVGGTVVGTKEPSSSTSFTATYNIPASLVGASKIAIRFDSPQGYYAYDWFVNNPSVATSTPGPTATSGPTKTLGPSPTPKPTSAYKGVIPTINIVGVQQGVSVSIVTKDYPAGQTFTVRIGEYGTLGIGGTVVGTLNSGTGGSIAQNFNIPAALATREKLSIRLDSPLGYYSYDWFNNNASFGTSAATPTVTTTPGATATPAATVTPGGPTATPTAIPTAGPTTTGPVAGYAGIPTFSISSVVKDQSVTISGVNFPPGQVFTVRMGAYGTMGIGGTTITTFNSGNGGSFTATYPIPAAIAGSTKIAIRLETGYYYAYNWFWNN